MILSLSPDFGSGFSSTQAIEDAPGRNGLPPASEFLRQIATHLNAAAMMPRTLFSQHLLDADAVLTATPALRFRYNSNWHNGRQLSTLLLAVPPNAVAPAPGSATPTFTGPLGAVRRFSEFGAQVRPTNLRLLDLEGGTEDEGAPPNAYVNRTMSSANGFDTVAVVVQQMPHPFYFRADTLWGALVNADRFLSGLTVSDGALDDLRLLEDRAWRRLRHVWAAWSSMTEVVGEARAVTGTTFTNLITLSTADATWSANAPGEIVSAQNAGVGPQTAASLGDRLGHRCAVYADGTINSGEVRFESSLGSVTITVPAGGPNWIAAGSLLNVPTTQEYDNVVISGRHQSAGETVRTWRWMIQPEP